MKMEAKMTFDDKRLKRIIETVMLDDKTIL